MHNLELNLSQKKRYEVKIGVQLFELNANDWKKWILSPKVAIVSNTTVAPLYGYQLANRLNNFGFEVSVFELQDGEQYKNLKELSIIFDHLLAGGFSRKSTVVALGGGVVGDMAGFAASSFMRGVRLVQIPTSLLSQVDSSVGGKTGVNHPLGKNMIGSFYQPDVVLIDPQVLSTLKNREFISGFAEIIKYGLIADAHFFNWLGENSQKLLKQDLQLLNEAIHHSCNCKAQIVVADEKEDSTRALLNLGHTFGHAIESSLGYGKLLHGEAVAIGMLWASELSCQLGHLSNSEVAKIKQTIVDFHLPTSLDESIDLAQFMKHFKLDKKFEAGSLRLILLKNIGEAYIDSSLTLDELSSFVAGKL